MKIVKRMFAAAIVAILAFLLSLSAAHDGSVIVSAVVALIVFILSSAIFSLEVLAREVSSENLLLTSLGAFTGLVAGYYLDIILKSQNVDFPGMSSLAIMLPTAFFGYAGYRFAAYPGLKVFGGGGGAFIPDNDGIQSREKILDTSVIIDGRILDIAETNFLEGPFIIPNFVLREIQLISDSPDPVKRNRGRRGLEMLNKLQQHGSVKVKISYADYADIREVDAKLVKLARETGGKLITNDFNLNKVAELQGVQVLNLNSLTNALKPVVLPGEEILIDVIKEGKDENQGIGYLEDGTMVVVENGRSLLGKTVRVNVTSIIQTAAGKMIFTRAAGVVDDISGEDAQPRDNRSDQKGKGRDSGRGRRGSSGNRAQGNTRDYDGNQYDDYKDMIQQQQNQGNTGGQGGRGRRR